MYFARHKSIRQTFTLLSKPSTGGTITAAAAAAEVRATYVECIAQLAPWMSVASTLPSQLGDVIALATRHLDDSRRDRVAQVTAQTTLHAALLGLLVSLMIRLMLSDVRRHHRKALNR